MACFDRDPFEINATHNEEGDGGVLCLPLSCTIVVLNQIFATRFPDLGSGSVCRPESVPRVACSSSRFRKVIVSIEVCGIVGGGFH